MDLSYVLNPVDEVNEVGEDDYVAAVTKDSIYMDRVENLTLSSSGSALRLQDGVLEPDHTYLWVSDDFPEETGRTLSQGNEVEEIYRVPEDATPENSYEAIDFMDMLNLLENNPSS